MISEMDVKGRNCCNVHHRNDLLHGIHLCNSNLKQGGKKMDNELISQKAEEIRSWIEDAVGDVAYQMDPEDMGCYGKRYEKMAKTVSRDWIADELFNDPNVLQDLCGDRIFDAATSICNTGKDPANSLHFIAIAEKMKEYSHTALVKALDILIERRQECLRKSP